MNILHTNTINFSKDLSKVWKEFESYLKENPAISLNESWTQTIQERSTDLNEHYYVFRGWKYYDDPVKIAAVKRYKGTEHELYYEFIMNFEEDTKSEVINHELKNEISSILWGVFNEPWDRNKEETTSVITCRLCKRMLGKSQDCTTCTDSKKIEQLTEVINRFQIALDEMVL